MAQATLINQAGLKQVVESGSTQAQQLFGQGYQLMGASGAYVAPAPAGQVAIPGAQYNTRELQQANFTNIQPIGNTLYGTPITPQSLAPTAPIDIVPQQPDTTNYQGIISGGLESANSKVATAPGGEKTNSLETLMQQMLTENNAPASLADTYQSEYGKTNLAQQSTYLVKQQTDLDVLNEQMRALNAEAQAVPIKMQEDATGRGITVGGLAPLQAGELRKIALRSLPLQGEILIKQAQITGSQRLYQAAQERFDKLFELRATDIQNQYQYKRDQQDRIWNYLDKKETEQLQAQQKDDDRKYQESRDNLNLAQEWVSQAITAGAGDIAAQLTQLSPTDPNFTSKLAALQSQLISKQGAQQTQEQASSLINQMTLKGFQYLSGPSQLAGLSESQITRIKAADGHDLIFKNPPTIVTAGGTSGGGGGTGTTTSGTPSNQLVDAAGKPIKLSAAQVDTVSGFDNTLKQLQEIKPLLSQVNTGPISGAWSSIARMFGADDPKRIELDAKFNSIKAAYLKALSGAAVSESEVKRLSTFLPSINDTEEVVAIKVAELENSINNQKESFLSAMGAVQPSTNDPLGIINDPLGIR